MALRLVGRDPDRLEATAREAKSRSRDVGWSSVDLTRLQAIDEYAREVSTGGLDVLIHSAGLYARGSHESRSPADYGTLFAANVTGPMYLTQLVLPSLRKTQGQIVFINSTQGFAGSANVGIFAATQHAMRAMADTLRDEVNGDGVRVLSVFAGRTATPRQQRIFDLEGRAYTPEKLLQPEDIAAMICAALRLPRTAEVTNLTIRPMQKS